MISYSVLTVFVPTFFVVSATPGLCMTLALTLGIAIGIRRALWMMAGELLGVGLVAIISVMGAVSLVTKYPVSFLVLKYCGGAYIIFLGLQLWRSKGKLAVNTDATASAQVDNRQLFTQGFITAVANPKGWAFLIALLPPFIDTGQSVVTQLAALTGIILVIEFICLMAYASGGKALGNLLRDAGKVRLINRVAGGLMLMVGVWLITG